jgi:hypothetical protein
MAVLAAIVLTALFLEDDNFVAFLVLDDRRANACAREEGRADFCAAAATEEENFFQLDGRTFFAVEQLDFNDIVFLDAVLFTACLDDCVHSYDRFISSVYSSFQAAFDQPEIAQYNG